jgi:hypothetical protein
VKVNLTMAGHGRSLTARIYESRYSLIRISSAWQRTAIVIAVIAKTAERFQEE